jgi:hypothetical protein
VAKAPYKCNAQYPAKFSWTESPALSLSSTKASGMKIADKDGILPLAFKATRAGPMTLSGTMSFSVCTASNCQVEKRTLQLPVQAVAHN